MPPDIWMSGMCADKADYWLVGSALFYTAPKGRHDGVPISPRKLAYRVKRQGQCPGFLREPFLQEEQPSRTVVRLGFNYSVARRIQRMGVITQQKALMPFGNAVRNLVSFNPT